MRQHILDDVSRERDRQEQLKAEGRFKYTCADLEMLDPEKGLCLTEETGEVCTAVLERLQLSHDIHRSDLRKELVHVAAVAVAWVEALDKETR